MKRKLYAALLTAVILFGGCTAAPQPSTSATPPTQPQNQGWTVPEDAFPSYSDEILYVRELGKVTGKDAFTDTAQRFDVGATDLGFCYYDAQMQRLVTIFGDTYGANKSGNWRSNVALYTDQTDYSKGIAYNGALTATGHGESGTAVQLTPNGGRGVLIQGSVAETPKTSPCIPTGAVTVGDTTYLFYMEVDENGFQERMDATPDGCADWLMYGSDDIMDVSEVMIAKAGEATLDGLEAAVQRRLEAQLAVFRSYGVNQKDLLEGATLMRRGNYLFYAVGGHADQWEDAFLACIR
jgi:hypothetical protein